MGKTIRIGKGGQDEADLLDKLVWPNSTGLEIASELRSFYHLDKKCEEDNAAEEQGVALAPSVDREMTISISSAVFKHAEKPQRIASRLGISRDKVYDLRRKLKRQVKKNKMLALQIPTQIEARRTAALELVREFIEEHAHRFYTAADVRRYLSDSNAISKFPSLSTIRGWMKTYLKLTFKKVNLRFKAKWNPVDMVVKLKFLWILRFLLNGGYSVVYIDEFNISNTSIKTYNWSKRGKQDYGFADRKSNKANCIIAVSADRPISIHIQEVSIKAVDFSSFVEDVACKLRSFDNDDDAKFVFVYDNASIHVSKLVRETINRIKGVAITLPPYTPEWNHSEVVINIIKRKIDSDTKQHN